MAKASFTHSCGHDGVVIANNRRNADGRAQYLDGKDLCRDCARAETERQRAAAAEQAQTAARAAGLPELIGRSDKAIRWGETLRAAELAAADRMVQILDAVPEFETSPDRAALQRAIHNQIPVQEGDPEDARLDCLRALLRHLKAAGSARRLRTYCALLRAKTDAAWWIDRRDVTIERRVASLQGVIDDTIIAMNNAEEEAPTAQTMAEAVLRPSVPPVSIIIVDTSVTGRRVELRFPVKDAAFNTLVKGMGYRWTENDAWARDLPPDVGPLEERMAETAQSLLAAGFLVRVPKPETRRRALTGDYTPEHTRWVRRMVSGDHAGWLKLSWGRHEDFYAAVMELPGARYRTGGPYVPVGAIEAVAEFAAPNGFRLSPAVAEALRAHRAALESGAVVTSLRAPPEPLPAPPPLAKTPPVIDTPTGVAIAPELLDDEVA